MVEADYGSEQLWLAGDAPGLDTRCLIGDINRELVSEIGGVDLRCRGWTAGDGWARR